MCTPPPSELHLILRFVTRVLVLLLLYVFASWREHPAWWRDAGELLGLFVFFCTAHAVAAPLPFFQLYLSCIHVPQTSHMPPPQFAHITRVPLCTTTRRDTTHTAHMPAGHRGALAPGPSLYSKRRSVGRLPVGLRDIRHLPRGRRRGSSLGLIRRSALAVADVVPALQRAAKGARAGAAGA